MHGQGSITIAAGTVSPAPAHLSPGSYLCLTVTDQGEGMDEQTIARAREPFFTTKGIGKGTGLGLSMVAGFAEQSGGTLTIDSRKGIGTKIAIWLPLAEASTDRETAEAPADQQDRAGLLQGHTVLLVDDDDLVLLSTQSMLEEMGAKVLATSSPLQALELLCATENITCVVSDYAMPAMTGTQLAAAIRVRQPDLPIIIVTGFIEATAELTPFPVVLKPFTQEALAEVLAEVLNRDSTVVPLRGRT